MELHLFYRFWKKLSNLRNNGFCCAGGSEWSSSNAFRRCVWTRESPAISEQLYNGTLFHYFSDNHSKATAYDAADRYETVRLFKEALEQDLKTACPSVSHLTIKNISVFGSKPGIGTTHIAIALASTLTANGYPAVYTERNGNNHLRSMLQEHPAVKEQNGICYYKYFRGIPDYGQGIEPPDSGDAIYVKDFGVYQKDIIELGPENFNLFILSGSPWDLAQTISTGLELSRLGNTAFICNYNNQSSAKTCRKTRL